MSSVVPFGNSLPPHLFEDEPCTIIYDPQNLITKPVNQLCPFGSMAYVCHEEQIWIDKLNRARDNRLIIILIFPTETEEEIRRFLTKYVFYQPHLYSLFLIFHNGLQYHEQWSNTLLPTLRWCRSVTSQLFSDIIEVCVMACNLHVSFYEQRRIQAEDNILNNDNSARSIARLFAKKKKTIPCAFVNIGGGQILWMTEFLVISIDCSQDIYLLFLDHFLLYCGERKFVVNTIFCDFVYLIKQTKMSTIEMIRLVFKNRLQE